MGEPDVEREVGLKTGCRQRCIQNVSKLISSQQGCVGNTDSSTTVAQTLICIILCVVRGVTAGAGSYLQEQDVHCVSVQAASSRHLAGQVASPSPVISVSMS